MLNFGWKAYDRNFEDHKECCFVFTFVELASYLFVFVILLLSFSFSFRKLGARNRRLTYDTWSVENSLHILFISLCTFERL